MSKITVWQHSGGGIMLAQLSDDPADGTPEEQIAHLASLEPYAGFTCVSSDYTGSAPDVPVDLWRWDGAKIVAAVPVPASVTPRQVRLLLLQQGLLDEVENMIKTQDRAAQIAWEFASEFRRDDPLLEVMAENLGLTSAQIDDFFVSASAL